MGYNLDDILSTINKDSLKDQDIDSDDLSLQEKKYRNKRYKKDTKNRSKLGKWATVLVSIYLFLVFVILFSNHYIIHLSDYVLSVLLATTTFNVLGLMYIVLNGYFQQK